MTEQERVQQAYDLAADLNVSIGLLAKNGLTTEVNGGCGGWSGATDEANHQKVHLRIYRSYDDGKSRASMVVPLEAPSDPLPDPSRGSEFARLLRSTREERGYTLRDLEAQTGVSAATISRMENGGDALVSNAATVAHALGINVPLFSVDVAPDASGASSVPD